MTISILFPIGDASIGHVVEIPSYFFIIFIGESWVLINSFLFSRSSNKASTSGIIKPMMLIQIGMINPVE
jgi:low temperature requirement protein LtrA